MLHNSKIYAVDRAYDPDRFDPVFAREASKRRIKATMLSMASANQPGEAGWFVVQTADRREKTVETLLGKNNISCYLPLIEGGKAVIRHRVVQLSDRPAMPGYILVHVVPSPAAFCGLKGIEGVIGVVGGLHAPHRITDEEIKRFKIILGSWDETKEHAQRFHVGDWVRFDEGPFIGFKGRIVHIRTAVVMRGMPKIAITGKVEFEAGGQQHSVEAPLALLVKL